ncbi:MAG: cobalt-precorrin-8X methylmutase [Leptolyngbya sp. SIO4C1]|nr:cobalt-precorrin-8X methylmutase [Leptolyngbya sp. SIO4C1]
MASFVDHPITLASFAVIDREIGAHGLSQDLYAVVRRVIHATADFEYQSLLTASPNAIAAATAALQQGCPIVTDVGMVAQGISRMVQRTCQNPILVAVEQGDSPPPGKTRTETGLLRCTQQMPQAVYVIGNAPTALLALCEQIKLQQAQPALVVGAPVGFINVVEAKRALAELTVPQILVAGRKGGSGVAAAIVNALLILAWQAATQN